MQNKIIIALKRRYHCDHTRTVLQQNALSYPVYELNENNSSLELLQRAVRQGAEILITGDVYAKAIMDQLDISVVTIRRSRIPFSDSIREALKITSHAAIVWRDNDSTEAKKACKNYADSVSFFPYRSTEDFDSIFQTLLRNGIRVIIGAGILNPYAEKYEMAVINVPYDEGDILSAVRLAEHNLRFLEERQEHAEILNTIQDHISEGILSLDIRGGVQFINRSASRFLGMDPRTASGLPIEKTPLACEEVNRLITSGDPFSGKMLTVHGSHFVVEGQPILVRNHFRSAILTITPVEKLQTMEQQVRRQLLSHTGSASITFHDIIGNSPALTDCIHTAQQYARVDSSILIYGQSGTGKEMFVQSIHNASKRRNGPFVVINCAALPENLIESELFGYEKGAFTGALSSGKQGLFVQAHQGTVFLDEVSEMPLHVQARFLRVLQEHEVTPIGSPRVIPVDIRVIAATNKDLKEMVKKKQFREDLYYRISVLAMKLPSLQERENDIELLIHHFLKQKRKELDLNIRKVQPAAMEYLCSLPYPGNIRQLSNLVERAMVLSRDNELTLEAAVKSAEMSESPPDLSSVSLSESFHPYQGVSRLQGEIIRNALERHSNNRKMAAKELGISPSTLYRKMKQFGIKI